MDLSYQDDLRLIEAGFPCHQVGAETQRERGAASALPPLYFLHVWWARRPLTPSRAAILASLLPADTNPDRFIKQLGIFKKVVEINGIQWVLVGKILDKLANVGGRETLKIDGKIHEWLLKENDRRSKCREIIRKLETTDLNFSNDFVLKQWKTELASIPDPLPQVGDILEVTKIPANPAHINDRIQFAKSKNVVSVLGKAIKLDAEDLYGYNRAFTNSPESTPTPKIVMDMTSGGGSIPFEALRLGHKVIANDLNPVACVILNATLKYPSQFGIELLADIENWGEKLTKHVSKALDPVTPFSELPEQEKELLRTHCKACPDVISEFDKKEYDHTGLLYCRQITCPHCGGEAPLLNTCWLSKETGKQWGVKIIPDGKSEKGRVNFETYRINKGKGPKGEDPGFATVKRGVGLCIHCKQAINTDEIKAQARGESEKGQWKDRLYCVVSIRFQPKLDKQGQIQRFKSGLKKGEIKTEKVKFFRTPNTDDLNAVKQAEELLEKNWDHWEELGLIPTEKFPQGNDMRPKVYGMPRWCDMFMGRQLFAHLTLVEKLNELKPQILELEGDEKGKAIITYLQLAIDKGLDYNAKLTFWDGERGVRHVFSGHDYRVNLNFAEMIFSGPNSGISWCLKQTIDAYKSLCKLMPHRKNENKSLTIINNSAAHIPTVNDSSVDLICMDPPYYNNVQYAELSDFFYVWMKRTLKDIYPEYFKKRLTNKIDEAVANPSRDGGNKEAKNNYEKMMGEIFCECRRVLKQNGLLTIMFTHKTQEAWETFTSSLIKNKLIITSCAPISSESHNSMNIKNQAAASSAVFLSCRRRVNESSDPSSWKGFGGTGVQQDIIKAVKKGLIDFKKLSLNPVDEMVACYGKALSVLSEQWPVLDGDEPVGPIRAMNEASRVVAETQISRITDGKLSINDMEPEAAMALTLYGIYGLGDLPYDEALNLSRSLNIKLEAKTGGYTVDDRFIGINTQSNTRRSNQAAKAEDLGFHAPLLRKGSKLRLALPEERNPKRLEHPQTEWDLLHGLIIQYREGDIPLARAYMARHAEGKEEILMHLLSVWTAETGDEDLRKEGNTILFGLK
ncbi:DUF1156 domain-containing protein [Desulfobacter hydrogenophilus]|uniref:DUF1156 domain-containing protein n=1 Tax=Desulfobacter hydrogenophilus TaxID=2291 RepID=A0A328FDK1_9BACT|nr:DUF1156 domain-containing protein [Desulfobacter hydrogenophilus]NDY73103.1 DUF1156 domain-containing protein [Desulfobacter hydrogenophilus]QBH13550.1 DUF1156 domain-containing protein [Desulfobacter hydrogenophilus]RAM01107.1 DUF1156 domain-containing protein [Desulfobacter hydrogenophilus]